MPLFNKLDNLTSALLLKPVPNPVIGAATMTDRTTCEIRVRSHTNRESKLAQNVSDVCSTILGQFRSDIRSRLEVSPNLDRIGRTNEN